MYEDLKYWYLRDHKLFRTLSFGQIRELCIITGFKKAQKGEIIYFSSSDLPRIFLLKKGNIKIVAVDEDGNETIKDIIQKGDLFGELALEADSHSNEYAKVLSDDVAICSFLMSDFENLLLQNPSLALSYTKFVGLKMKRIKNSYSNLISKDARTRLFQFLKDWAEKEGKKIGDKVVIENYLTQNDIAQIICTSRQTTTQLLNEMETNGTIVYSRREIIITDISAL
ncbi:Crp/Fnr family transcriptional regulator [Flavobacterium sp. GSP27]|uniref:Crp/Fnr family transcriptional regulator n=1 Tax=unclassified Flavobacterium TaxID=196869 RepID=UPI000F845079|nr:MULTISPECIES: Crp/Fnr family transcriptional regulator [unclassified Flavobacterium]RTY71392.1 Crp/Fnr family transcriptional regulator [Flavobacterium sp. LB2P53]RTY76741.1 Crp/Fnr family transcriptional regulator [Flavobacterium sp. LS1R10]RTY83149.1 Crp/Fnr family transcriptional regulator [Flavobacterium sp. ZB4P23]RTY84275.1 Crp/Fnr family transcriptional regulator [Flavobacterium sp. LS1P28]RTY93025.1 Crp/Fnr family transcriptional regulator [Flavobacterium sp. RSP46]